MGHFCAECRYPYPDGAIGQTAPAQRRCPKCGSSRVSAEAHPGVATASAAALGPQIAVGARLWPRWAGVAIEQALVARVARARALAATDPGAASLALNEEFDAALVAVAAAAHTLDALYGAVVPQESRKMWRDNGTRRRAAVREGLKLVFAVGPRDAAWIPEFEWLFDLRDASVHPEEKPSRTVPHPPLSTHTGPQYVTYSTESADRAVGVMLDVMRWCVDHPKLRAPTIGPHTPTAWAKDNAPVVAGLESRWASA